MRHGRALKNTDYDGLNYEKFMDFMLKRIDPPLTNIHEIKNIPNNIDIIFHSASCRARQTAELIRNRLSPRPELNDSLHHLLEEVKFSEDIISKKEFDEYGGLIGCRDIILKRWVYGENSETFFDSYNRIVNLDKILRELPFKNILLITHGWYLRFIALFYENKLNFNNKKQTLENLQQAHIVQYGEILEFAISDKLLYDSMYLV